MDFNGPFILSTPTSGPQTLRNPDGSTYNPDPDDQTLEGENANVAIITTPSGTPTLINPDGTAVNLDATVLKPYPGNMPPFG